MKSTAEEIDPAAQPRKRKRTIPSKLKASTSTDSIPLKRPRGRPPLNILNANGSITFPTGIRLPNKSHVRRPDVPGAFPSSSGTFTASLKSSKLASDSGETEVAKIVRPHAALVTQRILSRLMTEGPLSVADLVVPGVDTPPRDLVQSILDVLQVTAVVIQLRAKDPKPTGTGVLAPNAVLYAMAGIAKGSEYTELNKLEEVTRKKLFNAAAAKSKR